MNHVFRLLVVDDDPLIAQSFRLILPPHWQMTYHDKPHHLPLDSFHAALVDVHLTGTIEKTEGKDVLTELHQRDPQMTLVAMSGNINRPLMELCLESGASRFLAKPLIPEEVKRCLEKIEASFWLKNQNNNSPHYDTGFNGQWLGNSPAARSVIEHIAQLKGETGPILIQGSTGTGKEIVAHLLHRQEGSKRPFITINAAAVPESIFESEFFGHVKGAFTGAENTKMGLAEAAAGGDLFIDELEALPLSQQAKILRFLETGEVRRIGTAQIIHVNTRVIAATNEPLDKMVQENKFRSDLMWRVSGKCIYLPSLVERKEDIPLLAKHFLTTPRSPHRHLSPDAIDELKKYPWPGNVRELKRVCEQLLLHSPLPIIRAEDVQSVLPRPLSASISSAPASTSTRDSQSALKDYWTSGQLTDLSQMLNQFEKVVLEKALHEFQDIDEICKKLDVSKATLYRKIKVHNIERHMTSQNINSTE